MAELDKNLSWETSALNTFKLLNFMKKVKAKELFMLLQDRFMALAKNQM